MMCDVPDCDKMVLARGWCSRHYNRWYRHGDPNIDLVWMRFWRQVELGDCWMWTGTLSTGGYGRFHDGGHVYAHRWAWIQLVGPIETETLDHLCRNRACVNPDHLEPVSVVENLRRGDAPPARNQRKTQCKYGHPFTPSNTYINPTDQRRSCRVCNRRKVARYRERMRADA